MKQYCFAVELTQATQNGERRIRTSEGIADRFTVCSRCPLGYLPKKIRRPPLCYTSSWRPDLNGRPEVYKTPALPLSYASKDPIHQTLTATPASSFFPLVSILCLSRVIFSISIHHLTYELDGLSPSLRKRPSDT